MTPSTVNHYAFLQPEQAEEHFSQYLIDYWSYSAVATFARNEKEFERTYIYRETSRSGPSAVAGKAYHAALQFYFESLIGQEAPFPAPDPTILQKAAYFVIDDVAPSDWRLSKTAPTPEKCIQQATRLTNALITNFCNEVDIYIHDIARVLRAEHRIIQWLIVNGVDVPLPCHAVIDLVVELKDGRRVIIDHKTRSAYSDDSELGFTGAKQSIVYTLSWEADNSALLIDEVWYIENKYSANKDGSPQLRKYCITLDADTRRLYEALLYEPLRRLITAVSDPDYIYTINDADPMVNRAELYDFWARTIICDTADFNVPDSKRDLIERRTAKIRDAAALPVAPSVITSFRQNASKFINYQLPADMTSQQRIEHTLRSFNISAHVAYTLGSYSSVSYLLEVGAGTKLANIARHSLDIANALDVAAVRVHSNLITHLGHSYLCIEAPITNGDTLIFDPHCLSGHRLPLGIDNFDNLIAWDIDNPSTPHMLVCGATGSGKSVCLRSTIEYAMLAKVPKIIIFDPKYEFRAYAANEGVEVISDITDIETRLAALVAEMQQRAADYNTTYPLTLIVFDEFADASASARSGRELDIKELVTVGTRADGTPRQELRVTGRHRSLEENLKMLLQKGRSLGYRILAATQRASSKVISGDAKVNFPVQVCFRVPRALDSKVVLDTEGAERLAGHGDALIHSPEYFDLVRFQGFYHP